MNSGPTVKQNIGFVNILDVPYSYFFLKIVVFSEVPHLLFPVLCYQTGAGRPRVAARHGARDDASDERRVTLQQGGGT